MPDHRTHRGPHPEDLRLFGSEALPDLRAAVRDLSWLVTRSYPGLSALKLVGDRYRLDARQRTAVARCACADFDRVRRVAHQVQPVTLSGQEVWIDGFNVLTTIEAALSGGVIIQGCDGCYRDMASMHGNYHRVSETHAAIELLGALLERWNVAYCRWLFDQSVSNSGRLRSMLLNIAKQHPWCWTVDLVPDPDPVLAAATVCVASADSQILDQAQRWIALANEAIQVGVPRAWILNLSSNDPTATLNSDQAII